MTTVKSLQEYGDQMVVIFADSSRVMAYPTMGGLYNVASNTKGVTKLERFGNLMTVLFSDGVKELAYPTPSNLWIVGGEHTIGSGWAWPIDMSVWTVTSEYGMRIHPITGEETMHYGIDLDGGGSTNAFIGAAFNGNVYAKGFNGAGFGNWVQILHPDGSGTLYAHMIAPSVVNVGDAVVTGQHIGNIGATGAVTGAHLHYETESPLGSTPINPRDFMAARGAPL